MKTTGSSKNETDTYRKRTVRFLNEIGIETIIDPDAKPGFLRQCAIRHSKIVAKPTVPVSDLLHEAGHIAILPKLIRHHIHIRADPPNDVIERERLGDYEDFDHPYIRAMINAGDPAATAWARADGKHLKIAPNSIVRDTDYQRGGRDIRIILRTNRYIGIHSLAASGFCTIRQNPSRPNDAVYPKLNYWICNVQRDPNIEAMITNETSPPTTHPGNPAPIQNQKNQDPHS